MNVFVRTAPVKHGYTDASDEIGRQTPSTERRALFAVVHVLLKPDASPDFARMARENGGPCGYLIDHRHAACLACLQATAHGRARETGCATCRQQARVDHVMWAEARGSFHGVHYRILEVAECFGYKAQDDHGDRVSA